jgi:hypothetical protein
VTEATFDLSKSKEQILHLIKAKTGEQSVRRETKKNKKNTFEGNPHSSRDARVRPQRHAVAFHLSRGFFALFFFFR